MQRHDGPCPAGHNGFLHADGIEQQRSRVDVNKGDAEPTIERRGCAGSKREIRYNDLAAVIEAVMIKIPQPAQYAGRRCRGLTSGRSDTRNAPPIFGKLLSEWLRQPSGRPGTPAQSRPCSTMPA